LSEVLPAGPPLPAVRPALPEGGVGRCFLVPLAGAVGWLPSQEEGLVSVTSRFMSRTRLSSPLGGAEDSTALSMPHLRGDEG